MPENRNNTALAFELLLVAMLCALCLFYGSGRFGLLGADEPRYAQIAREMLERGDWVTPTLGGTPWLEKPVLYYWGAMLSFSVFGVSEFAARVPSAFLATLLVFGSYFFMRRFQPATQLEAAVITVTSVGWIGFGRGASTDMPLAATFGLAMLAWATFAFTGLRRWLAAFYVFAALATLAKGPVAAFLPGVIIILFALWRRDLKLVWRTLWLPGIALYLLISLPWYIAVERATGIFFDVFIVQHNLARFGTDVFRHSQPFWYYLVVVPLALLPWTVLFAGSFVSSMRRRQTAAADSDDELSRDLVRLLLLWIVVPVLFFSISQSKLPGYVLPVVPACALLTAYYIGRRVRSGCCLPGFAVVLHALAVSATVAAISVANFLLMELRPSAGAIAITALIAGAIFFANIFATLRKDVRLMRAATVVPVLFALVFLLTSVTGSIDAKDSARPIARELERLGPDMPLAGFEIRRQIEYGLHFYRNQPLPRYENGQIPAERHVLVVGEGRQEQAREVLGGREMVRLGGFDPQNVQYWLVAAAR